MVSDRPEMAISLVGSEFFLDFWKAASTSLLDFRVARCADFEMRSWIETSPVFELLSDDGDTELWRARIPIDPDRDRGFFRIEVHGRL
jgi:hypothetical protein